MAAKPESTYDSYGDDDRRGRNSSESGRRGSDSRNDDSDDSRLSSRSSPRDIKKNAPNTSNAKNGVKIAA